jgi:hypothetical protein
MKPAWFVLGALQYYFKDGKQNLCHHARTENIETRQAMKFT